MQQKDAKTEADNINMLLTLFLCFYFLCFSPERIDPGNKNIGFVFQFHELLPEFTCLENVCLPAWIGKNNNIKERAISLFKELGLIDKLDTFNIPFEFKEINDSYLDEMNRLQVNNNVIFYYSSENKFIEKKYIFKDSIQNFIIGPSPVILG